MVEFKSDGNIEDKDFRAKIIRAAIALSNKRVGGFILIGIKEDKNLISK